MTKIYIFDKDERARANGYDAVIVYGSVKQVPSKRVILDVCTDPSSLVNIRVWGNIVKLISD